MSDPDSKPSPADSVEATAAQWLARRDRGLSALEQAAYSKWLGEDPRHGAAIARFEKVWSKLDQLVAGLPAQGSPPDPDLLAPRSHRAWWIWTPLLAAAAAAAVFVYFSGSPVTGQKIAGSPASEQKGHRQVIVHPGPKRLILEDGSIVELKASAEVDVQFTPAERRVRLVRGEAYFTVAKNAKRPFIVSANQVAVSAVGTAFSVGLGQQEISVLVTEGKVRVEEILIPSDDKFPAPLELSALVAGQEGVINLEHGVERPEMKVAELTPAQIEHALSWQGLRLEFVDMSLGDIVTEFNRHNRKQLVVGDAETAAILVGGTFRADNADAFVRLLDVSFGVSAFPRDEDIVLRMRHGH